MSRQKEPPPQPLRILDANFNRIREGLRVLEDIARFHLDDPSITQELKGMRHELTESNRSLQRQLLEARNSETDVGIEMPDEKERKDLQSLVIANARRVQEALRVIEELAKLPGTFLEGARFKQARFVLYTLEQKLVSKLLRKDKQGRLAGLYVIIDADAVRGRTEGEVARQAINGGARVIQLRDKHRSKEELLPIAQELRELCSESDVLFLVNDYLVLALATDSDGLHIGKGDLPLPAARRLLPGDKIVGCSTATLDQALKAESEGADYIAVGSIYPTPSKEGRIVVGPERLSEIRKAVSLPLVAIGGINKENVAEVIASGADSVAVISAVLGSPDVEGAARQLSEEIERCSLLAEQKHE